MRVRRCTGGSRNRWQKRAESFSLKIKSPCRLAGAFLWQQDDYRLRDLPERPLFRGDDLFLRPGSLKGNLKRSFGAFPPSAKWRMINRATMTRKPPRASQYPIAYWTTSPCDARLAASASIFSLSRNIPEKPTIAAIMQSTNACCFLKNENNIPASAATRAMMAGIFG